MTRHRYVGACAVGFIAFAVGRPAFAEAAPITGTLDRPGYTVLAVAAGGQASSVVAQGGRFSLEPPASTATLHLRAPDGTYAGPIVIWAKAVSVRQAQAGVARAARNVSVAQRRLGSARGGPARRRAARRLARARRQLAQAKLVLADARLQAITLQQAQAGVVRAARRVALARRNVSAAQRRFRTARGAAPRRRAATLLRQARLQLRAANRQLNQARQLLAAKRRQVSHAVLGVKAGAPLGAVRINSAAGYALARLDLRVRRTWVEAGRTAQAVNGVPIGARNFGRVRTPSGQATVPGDRDLDGIPDPLDIDDDGDLILDNLDPSPGAHAAQAQSGFGIHSDLGLPIYDTANANAPGSTDEQIEATLPRLGILNINILPGDSAELDCGVLVYCSRGGTGRVAVNRNPPSGPAFPECCDADGDGLGTLATAPGLPPGAQSLTLLHGANTARIGTGDVLIQRVTTGGVESQFPASVQFVFATGTALVSYADTAGNSATVPYPVAGYQPGPPGPGTNDNPFPAAAGPDGNVVLRLTFWRPQRRPIPPEPGAWTDIGRMTYTTRLSGLGSVCPQSSLSETHPELEPGSSPAFGVSGFTDLAPDRPANAANTFTYTLNVTQCLASLGRSWSPGQTLGLDFVGVSGMDQVEQGVAFKR